MTTKVGTLYRDDKSGRLYVLARMVDGSNRIGYSAVEVTIDDTSIWDEPARLVSTAVSGLTLVGSNVEIRCG